MEHRVIEYSGCCYAHEPREFYVGEERHRVKQVTRTWVEQQVGLEGLTRQVWRVVDQGGEEYSLTYYWTGDFWEIERRGVR